MDDWYFSIEVWTDNERWVFHAGGPASRKAINADLEEIRRWELPTKNKQVFQGIMGYPRWRW